MEYFLLFCVGLKLNLLPKRKNITGRCKEQCDEKNICT